MTKFKVGDMVRINEEFTERTHPNWVVRNPYLFGGALPGDVGVVEWAKAGIRSPEVRVLWLRTGTHDSGKEHWYEKVET